MKTEADVRRFLATNPDATQEELVAYVTNRNASAEGPQQASTSTLPGANFLRTAAQGASFGLSDEGEGLLRGAAAMIPGGKSPAEAYREGTDAARAGVKEFRTEHPVGAFATELAGGIATGLGAGRVIGKTAAGAAIKQLPRLTRTLGAATGLGAAAGAGAAEGGPGARLGGALKGGAFGLGTAGGLGLLGGAAGATRNAGRTLLDMAGLTPQNTPSGAVARAVLPASVESRVDRLAAKALNRTGRPTEELLQRAQDNPEWMLADMGKGAQRLARTVGTVPSRGSEEVGAALIARQEGQGARLAQKLEERTGLTRGNKTALVEDIAGEQSALAKPLYEAAHAKTVKSTILKPLVNEPVLQDAWTRAVRMAKREGVDVPELFEQTEKGLRLAKVDVPVAVFDYMKQGLDDALERGANSANAAGRREARQLRGILNTMIEKVDKAVPEYQLARGTWAGGEAQKEAVELGSKFFNMTPTDAQRALAALTPGEREVARRAAVDQVILKLEGTGDTHDATRKLIGNKLIRQRLGLLFDSEEQAATYIREVMDEAEMGRTFNIFRGGSNTADKALDAADVMGDNLGDVAAAAANPVAALNPMTLLARRGVVQSLRNATQGVNERTANALSPLLTTKGDDLTALLRRLEEIRRGQAAGEATRGAAVRGLSTLSGLRGGH